MAMDDFGVHCGDCNAHFVLDPSGDIAGAACSECGGQRFFRDQPSPTHSDGTLRDMVDSDSQKDQGGNPLGEGTIMGNDGEKPASKRDNYMHGKVAYPIEPPMLYEHSDIPENMTLRDYNRTRQPGKCQNCGEPMSQFLGGNEPYCGNCLVSHPELRTASISTDSVTQRVEPMSRTLNMEPYPFLWDESYLPKEAGFLAPLIPEGIAAAGELLGTGAATDAAATATGDAATTALGDTAASDVASKAAPSLMKRVWQNPVVKGLAGMHTLDSAGKELSNLVGGGGDSGITGPVSDVPGAAPSFQQLGHADIPMLLMGAMDTPHSVKSVGEQHDDPQDVDQKEFNDGESDPNPDNPNLDDSGASGEDSQDGTDPHTGFHPNSPGLERMMMILPLLLHYCNSEESGENDPLIRSLHETLEQENPGYLNKEHPDGDAAVDALIQHHKQPHGGVHAGVNAMPGGLAATPTPQGLGANPGGGTCPNCGGTVAGDGSCPQCGMKAHPQGGMQGPGLQARVATHTGPVTPEQIAAVQQLLLSRGKDHMVPDVPLHPENYAKEMDEIQGNPNTAPLVDPSQLTPPPQPPPGAGGAMPSPDPSQPGAGGQPMQPMSRVAADSVAPRCPECNSGTTGLRNGGSTGDITAECNACGHIWTPPNVDMNKYKSSITPRKARMVLTDLVNPLLDPAADQHKRHERGQDSSLTFQDDQGQPLVENQIYELRSPAYAIPDQVRVLYVHPNEVGLEPVGLHDNLGGGKPLTFTPQEIQERQYSFTPSEDTDMDQAPMGGTPGLEQTPASGQTTDEHTNSYPNTLSHTAGAVVAAVAASDDDYVEPDENLCHKCGSIDINHHMSSANSTMHECYRCGTVWETRDDYQGREAGANLDWILNDSGPSNDDFFAEMERARNAYGGTGSRSLAAAASRDPRYEQVRQVLEQNKQARVAGRHFTPGEQRDLINEDGSARNADRLDLVGTHYETRYDYTGKANGANVPASHLLLGI